MSTIDDSIIAINSVIAKLQDSIMDAQQKNNDATSSGEKAHWQEIREELEEQRKKLEVLAFNIAISDAQTALNTLRELTDQLNTTAARMQSATAFVNSLNDVLSAANTAITTVQNLSGQSSD